MNVERGTAINGRCYARAAAWANADAAFVPDTCINGTTQPDARIYTQFDANYNVTALIGYNASTNTWGVVQRYVYTPYGVATVLDANWNPTTDRFAWQYMHQGGRQDPITGLYLFRHRDYSPTLGNWVEQDPMGYINGGSRYRLALSGPATQLDPSGLSAKGVARWGGALVGGAIGGVLGFFGGGAAGTVVEPGGGTIVGAGAGSYEGAVGGAAVGAVAGAGVVEGTEAVAHGLAAAGDWLLNKAGNLAHEVSTPFRGVPGSTVTTRTASGNLKQVRRYGPDGFPETDVDMDHDHEQGCPHAHDWSRPPGGGRPTQDNRGIGRPVTPADPKPE